MSSEPVYISYSGPSLLAVSVLNKGTAFSEQERREFNLTGLIPHRFETIEQQAERSYLQYCSFDSAINKHIYLRNLQDTNETLFYYLLEQHLVEMMPIIYTPTVGEACERFSQIYRRARGVFISWPDRHHIDEILHNVTKDKVKIIVVTDGSRILGLGDQGAGGMGIPIGKLSLYTACAGISPAYTLPVMLDAGTDNPALLNNPMYIGWAHQRIDAVDYDEFVDVFMKAAQKRWPGVLVQFEDFEQRKAMPLLRRYQQEYCCFNDDIQGTASVTVGSLLAACRFKQQKLSEQTIVFAGAGSAGCGIAEQIISQMCNEGLSEQAARKRIFMIDRQGLLCSDMTDLHDFQMKLAHSRQDLTGWTEVEGSITLEHVINQAKPTVLIGVSGQSGLFSESIINAMHSHCEQPIIFPLSNPSSKIEATPEHILNWTQGQAIVATGSPFDAVEINGQSYPISQCNNSYIFPGIGLAVLAASISRITDVMLMTASEVLAEHSPLAQQGLGPLLPDLNTIAELSRQIAFKVAKLAQQQGMGSVQSDEQLKQAIEDNFWLPRYRQYKRVSV